MRRRRPKIAKQFRSQFKAAERREFVGRHVQVRGANGRVRASLKQDANRFDMTGMPRRRNAKLQRATQRSLTPIRWSELVRVRSSLKQACHFFGVTNPASVVEKLPPHRSQCIAWSPSFATHPP